MDSRISRAFITAAQNIGVVIGERELRLFSRYEEGIRLWNGRMNLISARDEPHIALKHFLDALTPVPFLPQGNLLILDIGSGAGLPGIPLKIAMDAWHLCLLDASRKRTSFLKEMVRQLDLQQVSIIHDRTETLIADGRYGRCFDAVISRAALKLPQLIETAAFFLKEGGILIAMKGSLPETETVSAEQVSDNVGLLYNETHEFYLPASNTPHKIIIYKKHN